MREKALGAVIEIESPWQQGDPHGKDNRAQEMASEQFLVDEDRQNIISYASLLQCHIDSIKS